MNLFVYGTLMASELQQRLLNREPVSVAGRLRGYARYTVRGQVYPAIVEQPGAQVEGRVLQGLTPTEVLQLDAYEGPQYERIVVEVTPTTSGRGGPGAPVPCSTYAFKRECLEQLSSQLWDFETFVAEHLTTFGSNWD